MWPTTDAVDRHKSSSIINNIERENTVVNGERGRGNTNDVARLDGCACKHDRSFRGVLFPRQSFARVVLEMCVSYSFTFVCCVKA